MLSKFSADLFKENAPPNEATEMLLKAINTSCAALGHTSEAAKVARKSYFAYTDYFGLNSIFFSISPNDSKSFRVRLFADASEIVSSVFPKIFIFLCHKEYLFFQIIFYVPLFFDILARDTTQ